ncbi:MAG: prenyltransferase [Chloroflexi bacterium]|nr:prenyltransferase [Chloroflexota bacterium]MBM3174365.1 prenyltransferase [Chloroflexota bacterium]
MKLKVWFLETRPQFLLLSVVLAFLGTSMAWYDGAFHLGYALLAFLGLLLCHISVNVLNDYYDYKSGIDLKTRRTPFSGGSGFLPAASLQPRHVFWFGLACFLLAVPIGIYFVLVSGWLLLPLLLVAAVCILLYTPLLTRLGWPEWSPGVGLGALPVLGAYFIQTGEYTIPAIVASIPSGILVHNLLLLNEFPDTEADKEAGRKTLPITMGKRRASIVYSALTGAVYVWIFGAVQAKLMPAFCLIALLTLPFAIKAIQGALNYQDESKLMPAMANNVLVILLTQLLLGIGYLIAGIF